MANEANTANATETYHHIVSCAKGREAEMASDLRGAIGVDAEPLAKVAGRIVIHETLDRAIEAIDEVNDVARARMRIVRSW